MTNIVGLWQVNANGSQGAMNIASLDAQGNLTGKITFVDTPRADDITGSWNDAAGEITFNRRIDQTGFIQTYTGFLGDNHADQLLILAGFLFDNNPGPKPRENSGWFAQQIQPPQKPSVTIIGKPEIDALARGKLSNPIVDGGIYSVQIASLVLPLQFQWSGQAEDLTGGPIISDAASSEPDIDFDMDGDTEVGDTKAFDLTVKVTDFLGQIASGTFTVTVNVIESLKGE